MTWHGWRRGPRTDLSGGLAPAPGCTYSTVIRYFHFLLGSTSWGKVLCLPCCSCCNWGLYCLECCWSLTGSLPINFRTPELPTRQLTSSSSIDVIFFLTYSQASRLPVQGTLPCLYVCLARITLSCSYTQVFVSSPAGRAVSPLIEGPRPHYLCISRSWKADGILEHCTIWLSFPSVQMYI